MRGCIKYMMNQNRHMRRQFKTYDESPNEGAVHKIYDEPESPNEGRGGGV